MNNVENIIKEAWDSIKTYDKGALKLSIEHPLEWHVMYETPTNKALVIISQYKAESIEPSKSIETVCRKREDGLFYISFQLKDKTQEDVFISMCSNLIEYSCNALTEKDALKKVESRYKQWRKLMEHQSLAILSDEQRRGLIGELLYLKEILEGEKESSDALDGWVGPNGADQDFVYDGRWREIKTTGVSSDNVTIHSIEQLGNRDQEGDLVVFRVDSCAPETNKAFTLRSLIRLITYSFEGDMTLTEQFMSKLNCAGYIDLENYDKFYYVYSQKDTYEVDRTFPRIVRKELQPEIIKCDYIISLSSIERWKKDE